MAKLERHERFKDARTVYNKHGRQSMDDVAAATTLSKNMISRLENEKYDGDVGYKSIAILATHYGVSSDYLLGFTDDPKQVPSAIDHLGISAKAAQNITAIRNNTETADLITSLNLILEDSSLVYLLNGVTQTAAAIQSEISHLKQPRNHIVSDETGEEIDLAQLGMLGHFLESQITSKQIEQEILNNNPALANRFVVISGEEAIENHIDRISRTFSNLVKWASGYNELITLRNTMEE